MKKFKIGLTAIALLAGVCSVVVAKARAFANTAYWMDFNGNKTTGAPTGLCPLSSGDVCAVAFDIHNQPTGSVIYYDAP